MAVDSAAPDLPAADRVFARHPLIAAPPDSALSASSASSDPMPTRIARALACMVLLGVAALVGCGGSSGNGVASKSAPQILAASTSAAANASSVHVAGESAQGRLKLAIDLRLSREGGHSKVSLLGTPFEVIRIGSTLYLKGGRAFYSQLGLDPAHIPQGTWVKASNDATQSGELASLADLRRETRQLLQTTGSVAKGPTTTIDGQPAIELKTSGRLYTGVIYVATSGQPYPLELERHGRETSHITLTDWNQGVTITPPVNTLDISQLDGNKTR
jgi:hypothetical protein